MATPILTTKLWAPPARPGMIVRPRLTARLDEGFHRKLILVSAPAGFGKSTLVSAWAAASGHPVAWLSLDEAEGEPARFLTYLVAALQTVAPQVGAGLAGVLDAPQPPPAEAVLTSLINDLTGLPGDIVLVLDDYHAIDARPVDLALAFLIEHLPPQLHLVITTREDPRLPLARLRTRDQLTELRAADLRFTEREAAAFLNAVMGLDLAADDIAALEHRTEGWVAGLQLAALSMRGRDDVPGFVAAFAGDDRYVVDYLIEEVLERQPARVRSFLLETAILDRLSGSLCDAVTGETDGQAMLETLERANLFLVPLDARRQWYRYHHLFADVLRAQALAMDPAGVGARHRRASDWHEAHGLRAIAIHHAFLANDTGRAADLIELSAYGVVGSSQEGVLAGWLAALPDDTIRNRPVLCVHQAFTEFPRGGLAAVEARLRDAERWLAPTPGDAPPGPMVIADEVAFRSLPGMIAVARAYAAGARGDVDGEIAQARHALAVLPTEDHLGRGAAASVLGIGYWSGGDLEAAYRSFAEGKARLEAAGYTQFQVTSVHILAEIRIAQGRLREAERIYTDTLGLAEQGDSVWGVADLHVALAELHRERNELDAAARHMQRSAGIGELSWSPERRHRQSLVLAHLREAEGDLAGALDLLDEAARRYLIAAEPVVRPIGAMRARLWIAQGRLDDAMAWVRERALTVDDDLAYLREFEHMTLAAVLVARSRGEHDPGLAADAQRLLARLLAAAEDGARGRSVIEILVLQALAHEAGGNIAAAHEPLGRALTLAEPEGFARVFIGEGAPMARLLSEARRRGLSPGYLDHLLAALDPALDGSAPRRPARDATTAQPLVEPLSEREIEVLRLVADGLSNEEIAERLYLALSTVKGHNRVIFGKLDVRRRTEAVARARDLGLLQDDAHR